MKNCQIKDRRIFTLCLECLANCIIILLNKIKAGKKAQSSKYENNSFAYYGNTDQHFEVDKQQPC